jgi:hypothetical protein
MFFGQTSKKTACSEYFFETSVKTSTDFENCRILEVSSFYETKKTYIFL